MDAVVFATLVLQVVDFLREVTDFAANRSAVITQLCAWVGGIALVAVAAHASVTAAIVLPGLDEPLGKLDAGSVVLVGLLVASLASTISDARKTFDGTQSAKLPPLLKPNG